MMSGAALFMASLVFAADPSASTASSGQTSVQSTQLVLTPAGTYIITGKNRSRLFLRNRWIMKKDGAWKMFRRHCLKEHVDLATHGEALELFALNSRAGGHPGGNTMHLKRVWSWIDALPKMENTSDEPTELPDMCKENPGMCYRAWRTHPTFVGPSCFSYLMEESGFAGGAHGWSDFSPTTVDLRTLHPMHFANLFVSGKWAQVKQAVVTHILSECWDPAAKTGTEPASMLDRDAMVSALDDVGKRPFLLTYGPNGIVAHLIYNEYEVHCYALGGVWLAIDLTKLPTTVREALVPEVTKTRIAAPLGLGLKYPDLNTELVGVRADPRNDYGSALKTRHWFIGSWTTKETIPSPLMRKAGKDNPPGK